MREDKDREAGAWMGIPLPSPMPGTQVALGRQATTMKTGCQLPISAPLSRLLSDSQSAPPPQVSVPLSAVLPYIPIVQLRKLRLRKWKQHVQGHTLGPDHFLALSMALPKDWLRERRHFGSCLSCSPLPPSSLSQVAQGYCVFPGLREFSTHSSLTHLEEICSLPPRLGREVDLGSSDTLYS